MFATVQVLTYELEAVYGIALLIVSLAALFCARWSIKGMLKFIAVVAIAFVVCGKARSALSAFGIREYTVEVEVVPPPVDVPL